MVNWMEKHLGVELGFLLGNEVGLVFGITLGLKLGWLLVAELGLGVGIRTVLKYSQF